jgi:hypothetical protein
LGRNLLQQEKAADAQPILEASLAILQQLHPDAWSTFNTRCMLGEALLGQQNYAEAEPLLIEGYKGMKDREQSIPDAVRSERLTRALNSLAQLYEVTDRPEEAAKWKAELTQAATVAKDEAATVEPPAPEDDEP